jgi:hypothetical protein
MAISTSTILTLWKGCAGRDSFHSSPRSSFPATVSAT